MRIGSEIEGRVRIFAGRRMLGRIAEGFSLLVKHVMEIEPEATVKFENGQGAKDGITLRARIGRWWEEAGDEQKQQSRAKE